MTGPAFDDGELAGRVTRACAVLKAQGLDGLLISVPESIYWLTGWTIGDFSQPTCWC